MNCAIIKVTDLGTNCWSAHRFCGGRCEHVLRCAYPEKKACKAVDSEIAYLRSRGAMVKARIQFTIDQLNKDKAKQS